MEQINNYYFASINFNYTPNNDFNFQNDKQAYLSATYNGFKNHPLNEDGKNYINNYYINNNNNLRYANNNNINDINLANSQQLSKNFKNNKYNILFDSDNYFNNNMDTKTINNTCKNGKNTNKHMNRFYKNKSAIKKGNKILNYNNNYKPIIMNDQEQNINTYMIEQNKNNNIKLNNIKANELSKEIKEIEAWKNEYDKIFKENIKLKKNLERCNTEINRRN